MTDAGEHLKKTLEGGVLTLTLTRADKKNALTGAMYDGMADAFGDANSNDAVRVIVLRGSEGVFTAGNDLKDFAAAGGARKGPAPAQSFLRNLINCDKPVIGSVDGLAIGVGTTMLMHCDYVVASPNASFATPFIDLGLCPEGGSSVAMPTRLGRAATFRLLMLGDRLSAAEAKEYDLVDQIADDCDAVAATLAERIAAKPPGAMLATKKLIGAASRPALHAQMEHEFGAFGERLLSAEAQAAFQAFLKR